ncbi:hypothetical protein [Moheibacter sediminis]|uniref:Uncharacterized protein n=1 Tax=Moheibacter sediminis TaxID=1434700 RepID=A0A1W1YNF3_9FLAO|nr:hypothetical protein [Moheibacter sediminis]SMC37258.1 hypothetical protein SAMN06296427_101547 [Moheibacter sediminis]
MKTNSNQENKRLMLLISAAALILSIPLIAMQFTTEVDWSLFDFIVMGILLFGTALIIEFIIRNVKSFKSTIILCVFALGALLLIWVELAVGIFGTPFAGN